MLEILVLILSEISKKKITSTAQITRGEIKDLNPRDVSQNITAEK
jgi:hypothetical protein